MDSERKDALHGPWPTRSEELCAQYADRWSIYREMASDGTHGDWIAEPRQPTDDACERITASDIDSLAEKLAATES